LRYIEKFDIFSAIRYDMSISKTIYRYFRYIESSLLRVRHPSQ